MRTFTQALVAKWKIGKAGQDRSALMLLVLNPHGLRIETGYGLEGLFNDAKIGAILDQATPFAKAGNFDQAMLTEEQALASGIAADKGITLTRLSSTPTIARPCSSPFRAGRSSSASASSCCSSTWSRPGRFGWAWMLLSMFTGGGGGGGGRDDDDSGGGFGGVGGGGSGGGGASRGF